MTRKWGHQQVANTPIDSETQRNGRTQLPTPVSRRPTSRQVGSPSADGLMETPWRSVEVDQPRKRTAILLGLTLGLFGAHRFYLGQTAVGISYLLFCWTLVPFVMGLLDASLFMRLKTAEFAHLYAQKP
jgi:TM2 domain-containing membrane protein YozV